MGERRLYLDHAATTPVLPAARLGVADGLEGWANPSSPHRDGRAARAALEDARARIARALDFDGAVVLTSGATEAIEIVLRRARTSAAMISAVEHDAVRRAVADPLVLPVSAEGIVDLREVGDGTLVAIQAVNNETGVIQSLSEHAAVIRAAGGLLLADCAQSAGKLPLPDADFIAVSAHKLGGPPGIGALLIRDLSTLTPCGGQEQGYRGGTENLPATLGFAAALEAGTRWMDRARILRARLDTAIRDSGGIVVADRSERLPTIASYRMPGVAATTQLIRFDMAGISVSAGSACSSGSLKPSHVLSAMGWDETAAREVIRISFGPDTSETDIDRVITQWRTIATSLRAEAA